MLLHGRRFTVALYALLVGTSLLVFWPLSNDHDRYLEGIEAAERGDFKTAFSAWESLAEKGYPRAQYGLAVLFERGDGIPRDLTSAAEWYEKAARQKVWEAQVNLGLLLIAGEGIERDHKAAAQWFQRAADQGSPEGQTNLAQLYLRGLGVERDTRAAAQWLWKAAQHGHGVAQYTLATLYYDGVGVEKDLEEAYFWASLAAESESSAQPHASTFAQRLAAGFSAAQLENLQRRLAKWQPVSQVVGTKG